MALINCPSCGKRMSDKAPHCPHCQYTRSSDPESVDRAARIRRIKQRTRLTTLSMLALFGFVGGMALWWWGGDAAQNWRSDVGIGLMVLGFCCYVGIRVMMVITKRSK